MGNRLLPRLVAAVALAGGLLALGVPEGRGRLLGGHLFQPSQLVPLPFVPTFVALSVSGGTVDTQLPTYAEDGTPLPDETYALIAAATSLQLQLGIGRHLAVRAHGEALLIAGAAGGDHLAAGASLGLSAGGTVTAAFRAGRHVALGVAFDGGYRARWDLHIDRAVQQSLASPLGLTSLDPMSAVALTHTVTLAPSLMAAFAPHPALGLTLLFGSAHDLTSGDTNITLNRLVFGASLDVDLRPITRAPVGLLAAWRMGDPIGTGVRQHDLETGLFYTGRPALVLGLTALLQLRASDTLPSPSAISGVVTLRHDW